MADTNDGPRHNQDPRALPVGTRVQEYEILRFAEGGGFSLVYLARDVSLGRQVALREYMPPMASRTPGAIQVSVNFQRDAKSYAAGMHRFMNDARLLAQFDQPGLVKVHRSWEENGTAYMTMPFYEGVTLQRAVAEQRVAVDESSLRLILAPLLDALSALHDAQCYHRDISPDNILLTPNGRVLLDYGAARTVSTNAAHSFHMVLKEGYAPLEQYVAEGGEARQGPWTDIYALCAVMRYAITGVKPHSAVVRSASRSDPMAPLATAAAGRYSEPFLRAIDAGMAVAIEGRPQNIAKFRALLAEQPGKPDVVLLPPGADASKRLSAVMTSVSRVFDHPWARRAAVAALLPVIVLGVFIGVRWNRPAQSDAAYAEARSLAAVAGRSAAGAAVVSRPAADAVPGESSSSASSQAPQALPRNAEGTPGSDAEHPAAPTDASPDAVAASATAPPPPPARERDDDISPKTHPRPVPARAHKSRTDTPKEEPHVAAVASPPFPQLPAGAPPAGAAGPASASPAAASAASAPAAIVPAAAAAPIPAPPPPAAAADPPPSPVERAYMHNVVRIIQAANTVPDTPEYQAALMKLKGNDSTSVTFVLDRSGKVLQAKIDHPTGSEAVDRLAVRIVTERRYPPFPEAAWPGKPNHGFSVPFRFR